MSMDYWIIQTVPMDENGNPLRPGINGGLFKKEHQSLLYHSFFFAITLVLLPFSRGLKSLLGFKVDLSGAGPEQGTRQSNDRLRGKRNSVR